MDRFQRHDADSFREMPRAKFRSESGAGLRVGWPFKEQNNEQYLSQGTVIFNPKSYEDVGKLIDHLKRGEQVIVDFSTTNQGVVARILDFMSGAIYALSGSVRKITPDIYLFAPSCVAIGYSTTLAK